VIPGGKREVDLYAYIFGTDLLAFLFVAVFYQSFVNHSPKLLDVTRAEDQFTKDFIFVLMVGISSFELVSNFQVGKYSCQEEVSTT
jgi:hypothetical protein